MLPRSVHPVKGSDYGPPPHPPKKKQKKKQKNMASRFLIGLKRISKSNVVLSSREAESKENKFSGLSFGKVLTVMY